MLTRIRIRLQSSGTTNSFSVDLRRWCCRLCALVHPVHVTRASTDVILTENLSCAIYIGTPNFGYAQYNPIWHNGADLDRVFTSQGFYQLLKDGATTEPQVRIGPS